MNSLCSGAVRGLTIHLGVVDHADFKYHICLEEGCPGGGERACIWAADENGDNLYKTPHSVMNESVLTAPLESASSHPPRHSFSKKLAARCTQGREPNQYSERLCHRQLVGGGAGKTKRHNVPFCLICYQTLFGENPTPCKHLGREIRRPEVAS